MNELYIVKELEKIIEDNELDIVNMSKEDLQREYLHFFGAVKALASAVREDFDAQAESYDEEQKVGLNRTGDE